MFFALFAMAFGCVLVIHCPRAALREYRSGVGRGRHGDYPRETMPVRFWTVVLATVAAGVMGIVFVIAGLGMLLASGNTDL